ncbi:MAG: kelch repeat-containing protein, partial [Chloroflexota bacterium]
MAGLWPCFDGVERTDYLNHEHLDLADDKKLPGEVLRQRLIDVVRSEDLKDEAVDKALPDVLRLCWPEAILIEQPYLRSNSMGYRTEPLSGGTTARGGVRMLRRATISSLLLVLALGSWGTHAAEEEPSESGAFSPAGSLAEARGVHTATLLPDGRVLVVGGGGDGDLLASAEIWDPVTASFGPAGSLGDARHSHTATLLPDGRVLVVGGGGSDGGVLAAAEVWDPATASFAPAGSLAEARILHTATLLPDGRVLVVGGIP